MKIPMLDLVRQYQSIKPEIDQAIQDVMDCGAYIMGPQVSDFEMDMARFLNVKHAVAVASGSDALMLGLHGLGIGPGDRVIVPTFTFFATAGAVHRLGAVPVFADIDPETYNLDLDRVEEILVNDNAVKAIIPVHIFGLPCDMQRLMGIARRYGVKVIEDACQAINANFSVDGKDYLAGTAGDCGCYSFFPSKNLACYGDGGMLVTNDDHLADQVRILRVHGAHPKYYHSLVGYNSRLDTLQAAILKVKLKYLPEWTAGRQRVASSYDQLFIDQGLAGIIKTPVIYPGHVFHQYVIEVMARDELTSLLGRQGISTAVYYPVPLHLQKCFAALNYSEGDCPVAEQACLRVLALPIDPAMQDSEVGHVVDAIAEFARRSQ